MAVAGDADWAGGDRIGWAAILDCADTRLRLPHGQVLENNVELSVLLGLGLCFMAASLTGFMGLSPVFGAFCAGLVISHTNLRKPILNATQPLQSLLIVIFFVSIGLLVDLNYVAAYWG